MKKLTAGYNTVMWMATFTVAVAAVAVVQAPLKRALRDKAIGSSAYILWGQFGEDPQQYMRDEQSREKSAAIQQAKKNLYQQHGGGFVQDVYGPNNYRTETSVSVGTGEGQEALLDTFNLNQFDLKPDLEP